MLLVGRTREKEILTEKYNSPKSDFVALYGRRRVGKTFLIRNFFEGKFDFRLTGLAQASLQDQLENFNMAIKEQHPKMRLKKAGTWMEAFLQLRQIIEKSKHRKKIIFIDELPWFDTPHSRFIPALEHFWNSWASARKDILLIVCGSAASWMINKLINNKGGLHNRVTQKLKIEPFSLHECSLLLKKKNISLDQNQLIQLYMALGGIPFYWDSVKKGLSAAQNINKLCFEPNGLLSNEFNNLFKSLFDKASRHEAIIAALAKKNKGLQRDEISKESKVPTGGTLTQLLEELEESGFIRKYVPFNKKSRHSLYQLSDFFSLFHLKFIKGKNLGDKNHWMKMANSPAYRTWSGYAFEQVCLSHIEQIKKALGINGISTTTSSWKSMRHKDGAQIDLIIDRADETINLCEMKFSIGQFTIDKKFDAELRQKVHIFKTETRTKKTLFTTLMTTFGLQLNAYSGNVQNDLKMEVLFENV